jgi:hypothetical protein
MKYFKHLWNEILTSYQPEGTNMHIPASEDNSDYARMMEEVEGETSTIEEIDDTPE